MAGIPMLDNSAKEAIERFRSKPELSYQNYIDYIVGPLKEVGYEFVRMMDLIDKNISSSTDQPVNNTLLSFIRHDIDLDPKRALDLARYEYEFGITGTYHFISNANQCPYNINNYTDELIQVIALGHEVGVHFNYRAYPELEKLQTEKTNSIGKTEEQSELGMQFQRPSHGIVVEDCLEQIGQDANHIECLVNQRLQEIPANELSMLTNGLLRKSDEGEVFFLKDSKIEPLPNLKVRSFSYHMPPKGVIANNNMTFNVPIPNSSTPQKMVFGYYKGFMQSSEGLSNRYRTDTSAGGTAINHYGTPYHAYAETTEIGVLPPPIIMVNNHPEYWRKDALHPSDVVKEYVNKLAYEQDLSFQEADALFRQMKGESYYELAQADPEEEAISLAIKQGMLINHDDGKLYLKDGTHYVPPSDRTGEEIRSQYFASLHEESSKNSYVVCGSYAKQYRLKNEGDIDDLGIGEGHHWWFMSVGPDDAKQIVQYNIDQGTEEGRLAVERVRQDENPDYRNIVPGSVSNQPYYRTFDFGIVLPITEKQHSVLIADIFIKEKTLTKFSWIGLSQGKNCESAVHGFLSDIGLDLNEYATRNEDRDISVIFNGASFDVIRKHTKLHDPVLCANAVINEIQERRIEGIKIDVEESDRNHHENLSLDGVPESDRYFALFPCMSSVGNSYAVLAAPHIESKAEKYQTLPFDGDLNAYSRAFLDLPAAWDIILKSNAVSLIEGNIEVNASVISERVLLADLMKKKEALFEESLNFSSVAKFNLV